MLAGRTLVVARCRDFVEQVCVCGVCVCVSKKTSGARVSIELSERKNYGGTYQQRRPQQKTDPTMGRTCVHFHFCFCRKYRIGALRLRLTSAEEVHGVLLY